MRTPAALSPILAWLFLAQFASAQPAPSASAEPNRAPEPSATPAAAPAPAAASAPAAQPAASPKLVVVPAELDQPALEAIPNARDTLGGHFVIGASGGLKAPFGSHSRTLGTGLGLNLDLGYGLSRVLVLGVWAEFDSYSAASPCTDCSGKSFAGGPFLRYHLVQGTRFDPWGAIALGVRQTSVRIGSSSNDYFGVELAKLSLGGDFYPTSNVGFGPYVTLDLGSHDNAAFYGLGTGLRLIVDLPGK